MILSCFKQSQSNFTLVFLPTFLNAGARLLSDTLGGSIISSDNPLYFNSEI